MTGERNISLDVLRVLACLGVITIHTAGSPIFHHMVEPGTLWYNECLVMDALVRWSVPVFAMLTGFFLLDGNKELPIRKLLTKYVLRMVVALVVWSAFYAATLHMSLLPFGSQGGHFWYLGMVIGLYLSMPILRMIAANKSLLAYFCWTWLFFMCYKFLGRFFALPIDLDNVVFVDYAGFALWGAYSKELLPKVSKWILCAIAGGGASFNHLRCNLFAKQRNAFLFVCLSRSNRLFDYLVLSVCFLRTALSRLVGSHNSNNVRLHIWHLLGAHVDTYPGVLPCTSFYRTTDSVNDCVRRNGLRGRFYNNVFA